VSNEGGRSPKSSATMADIEALPPGVKGEIIDGKLYTQPRPTGAHQEILGLLAADLIDPYQRGRRGPGGWWIVVEPGIRLPTSPELSPDLAGWRRESLPQIPNGPFTVAPAWICEVHSPSTRGYDLVTKRAYYAQIAVQHLWYVDPEARSLTVSRLVEGRWLELGVFGDDAKVRAEPFAEVEIDLAEWWR
jgi:Uma2 family endonuclease